MRPHAIEAATALHREVELPDRSAVGDDAKGSEFHRITCFNGLGQNVAKFCSKGQLVTVEGRIHYTQWEDQSGTKRYGCEIIADKVDFLTKGRSSSGDSAPDIDDD